MLAQPPTSSQADTLARRARSAARRLLAGAGTASVVAFRREGRPSAESVHHAWLQDALLVGLPADAVADCRSEAEVRERCEALNERIRDYYRRPETGRRIIVRLVDVDAVVATWRER